MRLIDAEAFLKTEIDRCGSAPLVGTCTSDNEYLSDRLKKVPTIEAKPVVHAHWAGSNGTYCSNCERSYMDVADADSWESSDIPDFCPYCGAKMDEKEDKHEDYT